MKKNHIYAAWILLAVFSVFLTGCGEKSYLETEEEAVFHTEADTETEEEVSPPSAAFVYVCGEVVRPGVYEVTPESRVYEVIDLAGGLTDEADPAAVNQAETVFDGMMIEIPSEGSPMDAPAEEKDGRVNINTASREELLTLPGIGESKADSIIAYREEYGRFQDPADLMQIPGIKEGVFGKLKDKIKV